MINEGGLRENILYRKEVIKAIINDGREDIRLTKRLIKNNNLSYEEIREVGDILRELKLMDEILISAYKNI